MQIDLQNKVFWHELGIESSNDLNKNLEGFYKRYQKTLREMYGFPKDREKSVKALSLKVQKDKDFLLEVFLSHLERSISTPQISKIKDSDFKIAHLGHYSRTLTMRLNKLDKTEKIYYKPEPYPSPFYRKSANKIWFVLKKGTGKAIKLGRRKGIYKRYPDYLIIITKKGDHWTLRSSFNNMSEKRVIKSVFNSKKIVLSKEDSMKNILEKIINDTKVMIVDGDFAKDKKEFVYSFSSKEDALNELIENDFNFIFNNEKNLESINFLSFVKENKSISLSIFPHNFNVRHIKLVTTSLNPNQIWEISEFLKKKYDIEEDIYILKPEDKPIRLRHILDSNKINETDLFILKKELDLLNSTGLITVYYKKSFKLCLNKECFNFEDKNVLDNQNETCPNCSQKLFKFGASGTISRNSGKIGEYITKALKASGLEYKGEVVKYFNKKKVEFLKFTHNKNEFLLYLHESGSLEKLVGKFAERSLPVIVVTMKQDIAKDLELNNFTAAKMVFTNIFLEYDSKKKLDIEPILNDIEAKKSKWRYDNLIESLRILRLFIGKNFDLNLLEGKTIQRKGNHFERLITHVLKVISGAWIELGQVYQNKSVADGLGYLKSGNNSYILGFDGKLKGNSIYSRGLTATERRNQTKYINDFKKQAKGYGGLKSWLIVVKSEKDYDKFRNSIKKLKAESQFDEIKLLAIEPLLKICEVYQRTLADDVINKDIFKDFIYKVIRYKGDITLEKVKKTVSQMPDLQKLNFSF